MESRHLWEREAELSALAEATSVVGGHVGNLIVVEGPSGIGKTSLLAEARSMAERTGRKVLSARGFEMEQDFSFGLVKQMFEPILYGAKPDDRKRMLSGAAQPAAIALGTEEAPQGATGDFAVLHGLFWLTENVCEQQPIAIVIDDLQWADTASLRFLTHLLSRLDDLAACLIFSIRPREANIEAHLLDQIVSDQRCVLLHPQSLSQSAASAVLQDEFTQQGMPVGTKADQVFLAACHKATNGNPLLLQELAKTLVAERVTPIRANVSQVDEVGVRAIHRRVALWMSQTSEDSIKLAQMLSVLGDGASVQLAATIAGVSPQDSLRAVAELQRVDILRSIRSKSGQELLYFIHPIVRVAVYETVDLAQRAYAHEEAVKLLLDTHGVDQELIAAHLLRLPAAGDQRKVDILRDAASAALRRGSPDTAITYLNRALVEPPRAEDVPEILAELGQTALLVDPAVAADYLRSGLRVVEDPLKHATMENLLGGALLILRESEEALNSWNQALAVLPDGEEDLRRQIQANTLTIPLVEPGRHDLWRGILLQVPKLKELSAVADTGSRSLDCVIAFHDGITGDPRSLSRAIRGVSDGLLVKNTNGGIHLALAWLTLMAANHPSLMASLDEAVVQAYQQGSSNALSGALTYRAWLWLVQGNLAEAEADSREAVHALNERPNDLRRNVLGPVRAGTLMAQGRVDEAREALDWVGTSASGGGLEYYLLNSEAQYFRLRGEFAQSVDSALAAGRSFTGAGGYNPAFLPWRSEAALSLEALGDHSQAKILAEEEVQLARRWAAPGALGRALRVLATVLPPSERIPLLEEAVARLEPSPARLEHAEALATMGETLLQVGQRRQARSPLTSALGVAELCGATELIARIRDDMSTAGIAGRRASLLGLDALTPSERMVVELAAEGHSNRDIAQKRFVTSKTVEAHLGNAYRKLGITRRYQLRAALNGE